MEPGAEIGARLKATELAIGADEALLHDVLRVPLVASQPVGQPERRPRVGIHQQAKRLPITPARPGQDGGDVALPLAT